MKSIAAVLAVSGVSHAAKWDYDAPGRNLSHWDDLYAECGYKRQSPIDVPIESLSSCTEPLNLKWTSEESHYVIRNNGHSMQAIPFRISTNNGADIAGLEILHHSNDTNIRLSNSFYDTYGSTVNREYCFDSLHFHWGRDDSEGSEHTINGASYPLEVHLVHYSCDYGDIGDALTDYASGEAAAKYDDENVLAVIGVMFEIGEANPVLERMLADFIMDGIYQNKEEVDTYDPPHLLELFYTQFNVRDLLPESPEMVAYLGSLTTPPCFETVRWHLMKETMTVSEDQMARFRKLLEGTEETENMAPNYRPPQPRYGRKVWRCQEEVDTDVEQTKLQQLQAETEVVVIENDKDHRQWKSVAISFIVLFTVTVITCVALFYCVSRAWGKVKLVRKKKGNKYEQPGHGTDERVVNVETEA